MLLGRERWETPGSLQNLKPAKFSIKRIFWEKIWWFCENLEFGEIWIIIILNPKISKFVILNPNTQNLNLDNKNLIFWWILNKFEENFEEIDKFGDNSKFDQSPKFESLTPKSKIWNP